MKKLQKILMLTVLVAMLVGIASVAASAAATMAPVQTFASFDGEAAASSSNCVCNVMSKGDNKYYEDTSTASGGNTNFGSGNKDFLGKGDYIITEFDFMAEDWTKVKSILIGWNSRNSTGGALNDMHFTFSNEGGKPKITGSPVAGSVVLSESKPGQWHHFTLVVQIGGTHVNKNGKCLTAVQGQDAVEAYAYVDGVCFAKNLIGDGKEFWSKDTTYFQSLRLTHSSYAGQTICMDNIRIVQYEGTRELRDFFKYREKNGEIPDLNSVSYPFLAYDAEYDYPLGTPTCKVVEMNGNETMFDRFDKAVKKAASLSGSKVVLLADIEEGVVNYPVVVDRAGYNLSYKISPSLRVEEKEIVNPITGALATEISFIQKTKYAYYQWIIDHTGEKMDSRGYTPLAIGAPIVYDGDEVGKTYYLDGTLYTFTGVWLLDGEALTAVPAYAANSFYTLSPVIETESVYAIIETLDGSVSYALSAEEVSSAIASAAKDSVVTLIRDIALDAPVAIKNKITLDLAGKKLTVNGASAIALESTAAGAVITSSEAGAQILNATGVAFDAACAFTVDGENILTTAAALLKAETAISGIVIDGGVFLLSGDSVLLFAEGASLNAAIDATIVASNATLADPAASYAISLGGVLSGVTISDSAASTVTLNEGLLLTYASSFGKMPAGVSLADSTLVIAAKKASDANGAATNYVVADASETVLIIWAEGVSEYVMPGETLTYVYSDYYDAKKFYAFNGTYFLKVEDDTVVGNVAKEAWVGLTVSAAPCYDSKAFFVVVAKPDGTYEAYESAANLASLMSSGEYAEGTVFAIGQKNMILENLVITKDYVLDLNGYALIVSGTNKIAGGSLKIFSSVEGASFYSDGAQAFIVTNGALILDGENLSYLGGTLANLDATSSLKIAGGIYVLMDDAVFYKSVSGATVSIADISANKVLFDAAAGYEWITVDESVIIGGQTCPITVKYAEDEESI
ncbi:MAG: hypothetical protein J6K14_09420 [Clostridia bacterium]|nr:hypothetical protein [Clostridia bacterium]